MPHYDWAGVDNSNGYNGYWPNPGVKTDGIPMPAARVGRNGQQPIFIGSIYRDFAAGPGSIWQGIYYQGYETQGNLGPLGSSGGTFSFFIRGSAGTLQFGRCVGCGRTVQSENEAFAWGGTLAGALDYAEVPTAPQNFIVNLDETTGVFTFGVSHPADNGGSNVHSYIREVAINGGGWGGGTTNWGGSYQGVQGNSYAFRIWAVNGVGESVETTSGWLTVPYSGGRRFTTPTVTQPITTRRRITAGAPVELTIKKRLAASGWVDISN